MKFDLIGIGILVVCILVGNTLTPMLGGTIGIISGTFGVFIAYIVIYLIWTLLTGQKFDGMTAITFLLGMFIATYIAGFISGSLGYITGILLTLVEAVILSFILSFIGPKQIQKELPVTA